MILKSGNSKIIVGYDLGHSHSQISYYTADTSKVETAASVAGTQIYNIPTVLCKKYGVNQWLYGKEALRVATEDEGILVDHLLTLARDGESVQIEGEPYDPVALLTLFVKKSLSLLSVAGSVDRIGAFMITCEEMDEQLMQVLSRVVAGAGIKAKHICFQNYEESFYQYMIHQRSELRTFATVMMQWEGSKILAYRMESNGRTTPRAVFIRREEYDFREAGDYSVVLSETGVAKGYDGLDLEFQKIARKVCGEERISAVYLIGEAFGSEWMKESLRYLCQGRRVFLGSNLYSQGACLGMMERLRPSSMGKSSVFLGTDKLKSNVGMQVCRRGEESYCVLLNAGVNWYEATNVCEFYLREGNAFDLVVTPLNGKKGKIARMTLEGLPAGVARIQLTVQMMTEDQLSVTAEDLGFGEFRPASHQVWKETLGLYE